MRFLVFILFSLGNIFCNSLSPSTFNIIPTQRIELNDSIFINLASYTYLEDLNISFESNKDFNLSLQGDSLKIKSIREIQGYSSLDLTINNQEIDLMLSKSIEDYSDSKTIFLKSSFEVREDYLIINYKSISKIDLRLNKFWILFNNEIIDSKYYHIFDNAIRIMLPKSFKDGILRILCEGSNNPLIKENHTIIFNGAPLSISSNGDFPYFTNIYHLIIDRFDDGNPENSIHKDDYSVNRKVRFHGGDFKGIKNRIDNGYFNKLGVGGILISPITLNQDSAYRRLEIPFKKFMPFDGAMPVASRTIDYRYGNPDDLKLLIESAHDDGIEFYIDYISSYTDENHNYYIDNPDWYKDDSLLVSPFIKQLDYTNPAVSKQISSDIVFFIDEYNFDGFSTEGNSHINELKKDIHGLRADKNKAILQIIQSDKSCLPLNNFNNQNEFNSCYNIELYEAAREHFSGERINFIKLNNLIKKNLDNYQPVNLMVTSTRIPDGERFISIENKRSPFIKESVPSYLSYERLFMFMVMNYSLPGIPLIFYGDEFGQTGKEGIDSKRAMKFHEVLNQSEIDLKSRISTLNKIRSTYASLSIGDLMVLREGLDYSAWLKSYFNEHTLILFNFGDKEKEINISFPFKVSNLSSLLDENHVNLDNADILRVIIPPYTSQIYLLDIME